MYRSLADLIRSIVAGQLPIANTLENIVAAFEASQKNLQGIKDRVKNPETMVFWPEYKKLFKNFSLFGKRLEAFGKSLKLYLGKEPDPLQTAESLEKQLAQYTNYTQGIFDTISKQVKNPEGNKHTVALVKQIEQQGLDLLKEIRSLSSQILTLKGTDRDNV